MTGGSTEVTPGVASRWTTAAASLPAGTCTEKVRVCGEVWRRSMTDVAASCATAVTEPAVATCAMITEVPVPVVPWAGRVGSPGPSPGFEAGSVGAGGLVAVVLTLGAVAGATGSAPAGAIVNRMAAADTAAAAARTRSTVMLLPRLGRERGLGGRAPHRLMIAMLRGRSGNVNEPGRSGHRTVIRFRRLVRVVRGYRCARYRSQAMTLVIGNDRSEPDAGAIVSDVTSGSEAEAGRC